MKTIKLLSITLILTAMLVSACSKSVLENQSAMDQPPQQTVEVQPEPQVEPPEQEPVVDRSPEPRPAFLNTPAYFDFDSDLLRPDAQDLLETKAQWLKDNPDVMTILVEGHCDERGPDAYNMALGLRRAEAVKAYMVNLGLDADKIETQSLGEEKPVAMGTGEEVWAQNRRASFVIK